MPPFDSNAPTERISTPPLAASALKSPQTRHSLAEGLPLGQSEITLPYRRSHPSAASLYASTLSPPGSRSASPVRPPSSRLTATSVFGVGAGNNGLALAQGATDSPGDPLNLILKAFVPNIAVLTSNDTDVLLKEKGFSRGLWELLRPFGERVTGKVLIRDSKGSSRSYEDYSVHFTRFGEGIEHPVSTTRGVKSPSRPSGPGEKSDAETTSPFANIIHDVEAVVERHLGYAEESFLDDPSVTSPLNHGFDLDTPSPYYSLYLRRLLSGLPLTAHETFSHPVACVVAISSRNPSPIETLRELYVDSNTGSRRLPPWIDPEFLRYYVLVHDEEKDDITKSMSLFDQMKRNLGLHCHLLRIRGTQSLSSDDDSIPLPRSEWMSAAEELADIKRSDDYDNFEDPTRYIYESDATAIRAFVREMVTQSIVPTMERHASIWNDQVASKRRGMAGRFLGLTKRWGFGSSSRSSGQATTGSTYDPMGFYKHDAPEAILRKLADYAFMLRDWKLAYSTYDLLREDFNNDKAWKHHAAANEMAALSLLISPQNLTSKMRVENVDAMFDAAYYSYQTRCSSSYGALRCLLLGLELLRLRGGGHADDGARWGMRLVESRMTSPVGDALLKERLAICYASKQGVGSQGWGGRKRKSAFWSMLAAEAWVVQSKFIQAQRCLNEARRTYEELAPSTDPDGGRGNGTCIDGYSYASGFMLSIGQRLNEHLEAVEGQRRGRRGGGLGIPGIGDDSSEEDDDDEDEEEDDDDDNNDDERNEDDEGDRGREGRKRGTSTSGGGGGGQQQQQQLHVDEESEALDTRRPGARRASLLGGGGGGLETAPLRNTANDDDDADHKERKDDFG